MDRGSESFCPGKDTMRALWFVSYDIRNDVRLRKVSRILLGYGRRVQYSLYKVQASTKEIERLRWEIGKVVTQDDSVIYIPIPRNSAIKSQNGKVAIEVDPVFRMI